MSRTLRAVAVLALRIIAPCFLVAPLVMLVTGWAGGMVDDPSQGIFDPEAILWVGTMLSLGALLIGLPVARWVTARETGFAWRTLLLTMIGGAIPSLVFFPYFIVTAPTGMLTALACCLFNVDRLREKQPRLLAS
ncbi:hypothetical protein [Sphingomicrobium arenosum]|uniref:hypothetical protein n=1 Tax=Sphingomicrobium arenosum TaxID=2233861 RepID=UPI00223F1A1E|nr:hypothetical protein [Sphingomicrobium arenosum]